MSLLNDFLNTQAEKEALEARIKAMQNDPEIQRDMEFRESLLALMKEYGKSVEDTLFLISPKELYQTTGKVRKRKPRATKVYKNPMTGEVIKTRGGNHNLLKAWKAQHGADIVESWVEEIIDYVA